MTCGSCARGVGTRLVILTSSLPPPHHQNASGVAEEAAFQALLQSANVLTDEQRIAQVRTACTTADQLDLVHVVNYHIHLSLVLRPL